MNFCQNHNTIGHNDLCRVYINNESNGDFHQFKGVPQDFRPTCGSHILDLATLLKPKVIKAGCRSVFAACFCFWTLKIFSSTVTQFTDFLTAVRHLMALTCAWTTFPLCIFILIIIMIIIIIYHLCINLCVIQYLHFSATSQITGSPYINLTLVWITSICQMTEKTKWNNLHT